MSAILADSIPTVGRKIPWFSHLLSATHVVGVAQSTTQALANMDSYSPKHVERWSYCNHPKYGWKMENMSQTTNQLTIAAFFRPTRIDRKKNTPAI